MVVLLLHALFGSCGGFPGACLGEPTYSVRRLTGHTSQVRGLIAFRRGVLSVGADKRVICWDLENHKIEWQKILPLQIDAAVLYQQKLIVAGFDWSVLAVDLGTHEFAPVFKTDSPLVECLALKAGKQGAYIFTGSQEGDVAVYKMGAGAKPASIVTQAHRGIIYDLHYLSEEDQLISCGEDGKIRFWSAATGRQSHEVGYHKTVPVLRLSSYDNHFISGDAKGTIVIWDKDREIKRVAAHEGPVTSLTVVRNKWLISASHDRHINVWTLPKLELRQSIRVPCPIISMCICNQDRSIAVGGIVDEIYLITYKDGWLGE